MRRALLFAVALGCDPALGPPAPLEDVFCTDACLARPDLFGFEDDPGACADACEADPEITQELLNCLDFEGRGTGDQDARWRYCKLLF